MCELEQRVLAFWSRVAGVQACDIQPEMKLLEDLNIEPDDVEWALERFEIEFGITGRIGKGELQKLAKRDRLPFWLRIWSSLLSPIHDGSKYVQFEDVSICTFIEIAKCRHWPSNWLQAR